MLPLKSRNPTASLCAVNVAMPYTYSNKNINQYHETLHYGNRHFGYKNASYNNTHCVYIEPKWLRQ